MKNIFKNAFYKINPVYRIRNIINNSNKILLDKLNFLIDRRISEINNKLDLIQNDRRISEINNKLDLIQNDRRISEINNKLDLIQNDRRISEISSKLDLVQNDKRIEKLEEKIYSQKLDIIFQNQNKKEKILIIGYYGAPNMGDEIMLQTILNQINKENKDIYVLFEDNPNYNFYQWDNINFLEYPKSQKDMIKISKYFDTLIVGGGTHLDDQYYDDEYAYKWHIPEMMIIISKLFIKYNKKTYFLSLSSNKEIKNKKFIEDIKEIIDKSTYFSVRDKFSKNELIKNGINNKKIKLLNDPVFLIDDQ